MKVFFEQKKVINHFLLCCILLTCLATYGSLCKNVTGFFFILLSFLKQIRNKTQNVNCGKFQMFEFLKTFLTNISSPLPSSKDMSPESPLANSCCFSFILRLSGSVTSHVTMSQNMSHIWKWKQHQMQELCSVDVM